MQLADILVEDGLRTKLVVRGKKDLLQNLAQLIAPHAHCSDGHIFDILTERERLGSTGTGKGIAIPHGRLDGATCIMGVLVTLDKSLDFGSSDDEDVDLVLALIAPVDAGGDHLNALSLVSRFFRDQARCLLLRQATVKSVLVESVRNFDAS